MVRYVRNNGAIFNRRELNKLFGKKTGRPDAECWELQNFIHNFQSGCDWDHDLLNFVRHYGSETMKMLPVWYAKHKEDGWWAVVEKQAGKTVFAYFKNSIRCSDWKGL